MKPFHADNGATLYNGDCLAVLAALPENSVDTIITDPPYHLTADKKGGTGKASLNPNSPAGRSRIGTGFMGKAWDGGDVAFRPETWAAVLRVAKPGAMLLAFGGSRTFHRLTCAIEDGGWEIRDCLSYLYGSGFPKSLNFGCKCDKGTGRALSYGHAEPKAERDLRPLRGTDVPPPVNAGDEQGEVLLAGLSQQGAPAHRAAGDFTGNAGGEESCVEGGCDLPTPPRELRDGAVRSMPGGVLVDGEVGRVRDGASSCGGPNLMPAAPAPGVCSPPQPSSAGQPAGKPRPFRQQSRSQAVRSPRDAASDLGRCPDCGGLIGFRGWGTALKPAWEPIVLAMKPLDGTFAENAMRHGVAGLNIDGGRIAGEKAGGSGKPPLAFKGQNSRPFHATAVPREFNQTNGRWPANVLLDEVAAEQLDESTGDVSGGDLRGFVGGNRDGGFANVGAVGGDGKPCGQLYADSGGASRFFYTAKASKSDRGHGNDHPTVKPTELMKYLCNLTMTPTRGVVLDPFAGSGTTLVAARECGRPVIGIELEVDYCRIIAKRLAQGVLFAPEGEVA